MDLAVIVASPLATGPATTGDVLGKEVLHDVANILQPACPFTP